MCKDEHEILEMSFLVGLIVRVQIIDMQDLEYLESILQDGREDSALFGVEGPLVGHYEVDGLEGGHLHLIVDLDVLGEEGFGDFMGESDAFF